MKKIVLAFVAIASMGVSDISAKPLGSVHFNFGWGRARKDCTESWVCIQRVRIDKPEMAKGGTTSGHALEIDENGNLSIAFDLRVIKVNQPERYDEIANTKSIKLDSEETLPKEWLDALGYKGENSFRAGTYPVVRSGDFVRIVL